MINYILNYKGGIHMSKIMNKTSYWLLLLTLAISAAFFYLNFRKMGESLFVIIMAILLTYLSIWLVYYLSYYLFKWINRQAAHHPAQLLNLILIISILGFGIYFSNFFVSWSLRILNIISDLITALGYFYFALAIEKTTPKVATLYALAFVFLQTLLTWF